MNTFTANTSITKEDILFARKTMVSNVGIPALILALLSSMTVLVAAGFGLTLLLDPEAIGSLLKEEGAFWLIPLAILLLLLPAFLWWLTLSCFNLGKKNAARFSDLQGNEPSALWIAAYQFGQYARSARIAWTVAWAIMACFPLLGMIPAMIFDPKPNAFLMLLLVWLGGAASAAFTAVLAIGIPAAWRKVFVKTGTLVSLNWMLLLAIVIFWYIVVLIFAIITIKNIVKDIRAMKRMVA